MNQTQLAKRRLIDLSIDQKQQENNVLKDAYAILDDLLDNGFDNPDVVVNDLRNWAYSWLNIENNARPLLNISDRARKCAWILSQYNNRK